MTRIVTAARLQLVAWPAVLSWPWIILAISWVVNVAVFASMRYSGADVGDTVTGGLCSIYLVLVVAHLQSVTRGFPLALGLSLSRRSFYLGTMLFAAVQAGAYGAVIYLLRRGEDATDGWGLRLRYFGISFLRRDDPFTQWLVYTVPFLLVAALGLALGALVRRWGSNGVLTLCAALIGAGGAVGVLATLREWWPSIGRWFADQSAFSLFVGWPALLSVVIATAGYLVLRRTAMS
jgi:hypothetical protein